VGVQLPPLAPSDPDRKSLPLLAPACEHVAHHHPRPLRGSIRHGGGDDLGAGALRRHLSTCAVAAAAAGRRLGRFPRGRRGSFPRVSALLCRSLRGAGQHRGAGEVFARAVRGAHDLAWRQPHRAERRGIGWLSPSWGQSPFQVEAVAELFRRGLLRAARGVSDAAKPLEDRETAGQVVVFLTMLDDGVPCGSGLDRTRKESS
jgi:hypothetical protein